MQAVIRYLSIGYLSSAIYFYLHCSLRLAAMFGRGGGFSVGVFFFPMVFKAILPFGGIENSKTDVKKEIKPLPKGRYAKGHEAWRYPHCGVENPASAGKCMKCGA